jgi:hypothetical protein
LLKECTSLDILATKSREVVEIVLIPGLPDFLRVVFVSQNRRRRRVAVLPVSLDRETSAA